MLGLHSSRDGGSTCFLAERVFKIVEKLVYCRGNCALLGDLVE
jgi:hypothetical protein